MDPNQDNQNQPFTPSQPAPASPPTPPAFQPPVAPVGEPQAQPMPAASSIPQPAPFTPQPLVQPLESVEPVQPIGPIGSGPDPSMASPAAPLPPQPDNNPVPAGPLPQPNQVPPAPQPFGAGPAPASAGNKLPVKLIAIIGGSVLGVALLACIGWFVYNTFLNVIPLKSYDGEGYSILVPKDYKKEASFGGEVTFDEPDAEAETRSSESISVLDASLFGDDRDKTIAEIDKSLSEDKVKESLDKEDTDTFTNYKLTKIKVDGQDAREITATGMKNGKKVGTIHMMVVYGEKNFYYVIVAAHVGDTSFNNAAGKIMSSFKIK